VVLVEDVDVEDVDVEDDVVVVVVTLLPVIGSDIEFVQSPFDLNCTIVAALGTDVERYPANNNAFEIFISKGTLYPSASEYKSKGPVSDPAIVNVIKTDCAIKLVL
jgi:hypothetical protein